MRYLTCPKCKAEFGWADDRMKLGEMPRWLGRRYKVDRSKFISRWEIICPVCKEKYRIEE